MSIVSEAIGLLSEALLSSSGSVFHKCAHTEQIFSDLWTSSTRNLNSKLDDILQLHDQLLFWAECSLCSFPRIPSAFIAFVCDVDEFRCAATQLLRHLGTGGSISSSNRLVARMLVAMSPHCATKIAAWSLDCGAASSDFFGGSSPGPLQGALAATHAAASAISTLEGDALFRRRLYSQLISCSKDSCGAVCTRVRAALATVSEKHHAAACARELFLSLLKAMKTDSSHHDPSPTTISFACVLLASCQVLCESQFDRQELLSSIFQGFPSADASSYQFMNAISEVAKLSRSLSESKMQCELVYESLHPFSCSTHQFDIVFPLAREVSVVFDARTCTDLDWVLKICHGRHSIACFEGDNADEDHPAESGARHWPGVGSTPPLIVPGPCFTVKMMESSCDTWGFRFTATASYDHPLVEIQSFITDAAIKCALQTILTEERFAFLHPNDAALCGRIAQDLDFISDIASDAAHVNTLKRFCEQKTIVFSNIFKWVLYFSLNSADHAAALVCYERYFCFLNMAKDLFAQQHRSSMTSTPPALHSTVFTTQSCVDVFTDREFPFEMHELDKTGELVLNLKVSSSKSKASNLLTSRSRGWCSNGRQGSVSLVIFCCWIFLCTYCLPLVKRRLFN
jgi:hypothetical protein